MALGGELLSNGVLIVFGLFFGAVGLVLLGTGISSGYRAVKIKTSDVTPIASVRSTTDGPIEVTGSVQDVNDLDTITAPLSGTACYAWETIRYKRRVDTDSRRKKYKTEVRAKQATPFVLRDDSGGEVEINPENASLSLNEGDYTVSQGDPIGDDARRRIRNLSAEQVELSGRQSSEEMEPEALLSSTNPKYEERVLVPGDEVHVYGATAQAPTSRSRQAELTGDDFYTITEGDESVAIRKKLIGACIVGIFGLAITLAFGLLPVYSGISNLLGSL